MRKGIVILICFSLLVLITSCGGSSGSGGGNETPDPPSAQVTVISSGAAHTIALMTDGTPWAWGDNGSGRLGDGTAWKETPVDITF